MSASELSIERGTCGESDGPTRGALHRPAAALGVPAESIGRGAATRRIGADSDAGRRRSARWPSGSGGTSSQESLGLALTLAIKPAVDAGRRGSREALP